MLFVVGVLIVVALVICSKPLPERPRHRSDRASRTVSEH
jgi:hypothetical protein